MIDLGSNIFVLLRYSVGYKEDGRKREESGEVGNQHFHPFFFCPARRPQAAMMSSPREARRVQVTPWALR